MYRIMSCHRPAGLGEFPTVGQKTAAAEFCIVHGLVPGVPDLHVARLAAATRIQSCPHISLHLLRHHCADMLISIQFCTTVFKKTHADLWTALKAYGCLEEPKPDVIRSASLGCVHKVNTDSQLVPRESPFHPAL
ncbi:hypothetical protein WJX77_008851 [Trebouxia sp. C0004]